MSKSLREAKRLMGALVHMPPKPHEDMKLGKPKSSRVKSPKKKANSRAAYASVKSA